MIDNLKREIALAERAELAYKNFIAPFIDNKKIEIFKEFSTIDVTETELMLKLKNELTAYQALEDNMLTIINTGKLASKTLEKEAQNGWN